jgi:hypothetical protein
MAPTIGIASMAALAFALCDVLHELSHAAATLAPVRVTAVSISTIGVSTTGSSAVVAAVGPLTNLVLGLSVLLARTPALTAPWRWFTWLFGTINPFNASAYLLYSAVLGSGDWAVVFDAIAATAVWRPLVGVAGLACYVGSVWVSLRILGYLLTSAVIAARHVDRYCSTSYWVGGLLLTAGAVFNPVSPWLILTSGAATGFGAMVGLLLLPPLSRRTRPTAGGVGESLRIGGAWIGAGVVAAVVFIGVLGPGLPLA